MSHREKVLFEAEEGAEQSCSVVASSALVPAGVAPAPTGMVICCNCSVAGLKLTASGKLELSWFDSLLWGHEPDT